MINNQGANSKHQNVIIRHIFFVYYGCEACGALYSFVKVHVSRPHLFLVLLRQDTNYTLVQLCRLFDIPPIGEG